ncbi:winged helix-turn-helix domain-containing protein [Oceaniglobus trochenteri]|uniref:winged helix-turn-helix domain-containing protein n=1 Tax=Oceaniglobus trochenteri TaxID=2763260 RepID=UPI001CFFA6A2|nr:crosslink repair DNA glycosylase YcaQ family protein [Oceaniglobus trochenteri]
MALPRLANTEARRLFLHRHALLAPPTGPGKGADLLSLITDLGFVQVDSVSTVERAHHMILHARRTSYRPAHLAPLLERERSLFEHWTHDASVIPMVFLPYWRLRFARDGERLDQRWSESRRPGYRAECANVLRRIRDTGPCRSDDFIERGGEARKAGGGWWDWHPSKTALEYLWRSGALAIARREGFRKVYDLAENIYPPHSAPDDKAIIDWACGAALDRLGFATSGELAAFWALITPAEAKGWSLGALASGDVIEIEVEAADGTWRRHLARPDVLANAANLPPPGAMIRVLSPFDPALRDRKRAQRLFGFDYRIEIFTPAAQRKYGYYVFPLLQGDRMIGRIDMATDRAAGILHVTAFWPETGIRMGATRTAQLAAALQRTARFAGCDSVTWADDWMRA